MQGATIVDQIVDISPAENYIYIPLTFQVLNLFTICSATYSSPLIYSCPSILNYTASCGSWRKWVRTRDKFWFGCKFDPKNWGGFLFPVYFYWILKEYGLSFLLQCSHYISGSFVTCAHLSEICHSTFGLFINSIDTLNQGYIKPITSLHN